MAEVEGIVAGRRPVLEALKAGRPVNKLMIGEGSEGGSLIEIIERAKEARIPISRVPRTSLDRLAGQGHQGVALSVAAREYVELEDVVARNTGQPPLIVILDEVNDPHNLGAILRSSEATGVQGVVLPKRRSVALTHTVAKASAGAVEYVPVARVNNLVQAIEELKEKGYWIVGTDVEKATDYTEVDYKGPTALVIGAEGQGLTRLVKEHCDFLVKLPMLGVLQSLNASVATGVLLYEIVRQRMQ